MFFLFKTCIAEVLSLYSKVLNFVWTHYIIAFTKMKEEEKSKSAKIAFKMFLILLDVSKYNSKFHYVKMSASEIDGF